MIQHEGQYCGAYLRRALLHSAGTKTSTIAALSDGMALTAVAHGLRSACLISSFPTTFGNVIALQTTIMEALSSVDQLIILVHRESEQTFVVNVKAFEDRQRAQADHPSALFYYLNGSRPSGTIDVPTGLHHLLKLLQKSFRRTHASSTSDSNVPLLCTNAVNTSPIASRKIGVALAGWLLEYSVIYCFEEEKNLLDANAFDVHELTPSDFALTDAFESAIHLSESTQHLRGLSLLLVTVELSPEGKDKFPLYQFTLPEAIVIAERKNDIIEEINTRMAPRLKDTSLQQCSVLISWKNAISGPIAL